MQDSFNIHTEGLNLLTFQPHHTTMSRTWKGHNLYYCWSVSTCNYRTGEDIKNGRSHYIARHPIPRYRYRSTLRAFVYGKQEKKEENVAGIRPRTVRPDPWGWEAYRGKNASSYYLKPLRHPKLERRRAARKAAVREMDTALY